jgi:hypothetical protein
MGEAAIEKHDLNESSSRVARPARLARRNPVPIPGLFL